MIKSEKPDWQSKDLNIGLEVTEALISESGRKRSIINHYFGIGSDVDFIKGQIEDKYPEYANDFLVINGAAAFSEMCDMQSKIEKVIESIEVKFKKINDHYMQFKDNWLYVFGPSMLCEKDIRVIYDNYKEFIAKYKITFNKIFINSLDSIFILNHEGLENIISVSDECLKKLKIDSEKNIDTIL